MARSSKNDSAPKSVKGAPKRSKTAANETRWQPPNHGRQIVAFWKQNDLGLFGRRPDRFIQAWGADPSIDKVLVFELPTTLAALNNWTRLAANPNPIHASEFRLLLSNFFKKYHGELNSEKVHYCSYLQADDNLNGPAYLRWVLAKLKEAQVKTPELWLWPICAINEALIQAISPSRLVVDFVDDQRLFPGTENVQQSYTRQYEWLIRKADVCYSNSEGLIQSLNKEFEAKLSLLKNDELGPESQSSLVTKPLKSAKRTDQPIVGFVGNMRGRMNIPLLSELISGYPEVRFVFVGQTHGSDFYKACAKEPNVQFMGTLPQDEANKVAQSFDLAVIPFVNDALVKSMSPIKAVTFNQLGVATLSSLELSESQFKKEFKKAVGQLASAASGQEKT